MFWAAKCHVPKIYSFIRIERFFVSVQTADGDHLFFIGKYFWEYSVAWEDRIVWPLYKFTELVEKSNGFKFNTGDIDLFGKLTWQNNNWIFIDLWVSTKIKLNAVHWHMKIDLCLPFSIRNLIFYSFSNLYTKQWWL